MHPSLAPLGALIQLNSKLFLNVLADIDEAGATARPNDRTNNVAFLGGHLVETRAWMARYLGLEEKSPFNGVLEHATKLEDVPVLPSLAVIRATWREQSPRLEARLEELTETDLTGPSSPRFPGVPETMLGGIAFLVQHESYHVGQLAFLRRYLGLPAMSYKVGSRT
ncbi:MAG: DinB family protein [Gemmatimonadota bacterium]